MKLNSELDAEKREGVGRGCWVKVGDNWWLAVSARLRDYAGRPKHELACPTMLGGMYISDVLDRDITAVHEPCREPKMETAYLFGQADTVTREEALELIQRGTHRWAGTVCVGGKVGGTHVENRGGNVWAIREASGD